MSSLMMNISTAFILLALAGWISSLFTRIIWWRWLMTVAVVTLSHVIPVVDGNPWTWLNGATGELSIVSLILLAGFILRKLVRFDLLLRTTRLHIYLLILLSGALLFPATLGLTQFDPYTFGYSFEISLLLLSLAILYWIFSQRQVASILLIVVAAGEAGILTSLNTWDYLIDPLLWLFSPVILAILLTTGRQRETAHKPMN